MSDRPNNKRPDEPENSTGRRDGWRTPKQSAVPQERHTWRTASDEEAEGVDQPQSWRVPTLPRDLDEKPGGWRLPKPQDTVYSPDDESEIIPAAAPAEATPTPETETTADVIPFEDTSGASSAEPVPLEAADEDEDDSFSMSELVALASLVDHVPSVEVQQAQPTNAPVGAATGEFQPAQAAASPTVEDQLAGTSAEPVIDPAEYARRELARLQGTGAAAPPEESAGQQTPAQQETSGIVSPEDYAKQQLALLNVPQTGQPAAESPAAAPSTLTEKFRQAEASIRSLRQQYQQGQLTRDDFQGALRRLMVLDDNNVWWMMGVESDRWYRHDNGVWVPAAPPALSTQAGVPTVAEAPAVVPPANDTGNEGDRTIPTSPMTDQWVPRRVPVTDPDFTVPNTVGTYLNQELSADTVPMATIRSGTFDGGATVPNPAIQMNMYESVAAPISTDQPPSYDAAAASPAYEDAIARQRQTTVRTVAIIAAVSLALLFLLGAIGAIGLVLYYNSLVSPYQDQIAALANYQPQFLTARILAADGSLIAELTSPQGGAREEVTLNQIAPEMIHAVVSVENERYFEDPGWDPVAITRAFIQNVTSGNVESGASTITQQIARNLILQDTTISPARKLTEIAVAAEIARTYDKNFILQLYLNEVFFGNQSYGVEAASRFYFGHSASDLSLAEAAMLAGLIQRPATYDPVINREAAFDRMEVVLQRQAEVGCLQFSFAPYDQQPFCITGGDISSPQTVLQKAQVETRPFTPRTFTVKYPHFVNFVQQQIENNFGTSEMFRRGFQITTTLMPRVQDVAQTALEAQVQALAPNGVNTGAVMVTDPRDGAIRAMIGSPDFSDDSIDGQVNNAFTWQQPGSSIKIVEYAGSLEGVNRNGVNDYMTLATVLWDVPTTFQNPNYAPVNYDRQFHGPVALRYALANSYNVPAVKVLNYIGIDKFLDVAARIGLRFLPDAQFSLASALGANEVRMYDMMQAYGTIANNGTRVPLYSITSIKDATGAEIELPGRPQPALAVQPQIAFLIQSILTDNEARTPAFGAGSPLNVNGYPGLVAAKTGTSNDNRDLWTMGFSSNAVVGVWIGRVDNGPTQNTSGLAAAPIWNAVMTAALQGTNPTPFNPPGGIVQQQICADTGTAYDPNVGCTVVRTEYFVQSQPPTAASVGFVQTVAVDTWTGLRANQFCADSVVTETFVNINDPSAIAWLQTPQGAAYAQAIGLPNPPEAPPTAECTQNTVQPQVRFTAPTNGQQVTSLVQFSGTASGPNFARYQIELAPAANPNSFQVIAGPFNTQVNGSMATWDSTAVPNGAYRLRLSAFATDGGYRYDTIDIGVNNILPTQPPPTLPPVIVPTTDPASTPIPFGQQLVPTPTVFLGG